MQNRPVAVGIGTLGIIGSSLTIALIVAIMEHYGRILKAFLKKSTHATDVAVTSADVVGERSIHGVEFI